MASPITNPLNMRLRRSVVGRVPDRRVENISDGALSWEAYAVDIVGCDLSDADD
jgi:hypothetical protein